MGYWGILLEKGDICLKVLKNEKELFVGRRVILGKDSKGGEKILWKSCCVLGCS